MARHLWKMVSPTFETEQGEAEQGEAAVSQPAMASASAPGQGPPSAPTSEFRLDPKPEAHAAKPVQSNDPEAGCPSSRCTPRNAIKWREVEPFEAWETLLSCLRNEREDLLAAVLAELGLSSLGDESVEVATPSNSFAADQINSRPELRAEFERFTGLYFGQTMRLRLIDATPCLPDLPSVNLVERERARQRLENARSEAQHNPDLRNVLSTFGAELTDVQPLEGFPQPKGL